MKFTNQETIAARAELKELVATTVATMYPTTDIKADIQLALNKARLESIKVLTYIPEAKRFDAEQHYDIIKSYIIDNFEEGERTHAYKYANIGRRIALLASILSSRTRLRKVVKDTLEGTVKAELRAKKGSKPTLSQSVSSCTLKPSIVFKNTSSTEITADLEDQFTLAEIKVQLINELCELDYLDMKVSDHTHMVSIPSNRAQLVDKEVWNHMWELSQLIDHKTILVDAPAIDPKRMVTTSSWFYRTPELSIPLQQYFTVQHNVKYAFTDDALDRVEAMYIEHIRKEDCSMPDGYKDWVPTRIEFLKAQIRASQANGGHYIPMKGDSVWRAYAQCEIGHFQTSKHLRSLVRVVGMDNPIKKDFRNNVVQMYSLLTGTKDLARYVGLVEETSRKEDLRLLIASKLNTTLEVDVFNKDNIKPLFMVWAYNAGKNRILDGVTVDETQVYGGTISKVKVAGLIELTGAKNDETNRNIIWDAFNEVVTEAAPIIIVLKALFKKLIAQNPLTETSWTLPDGAIAQYTSVGEHKDVLHFVNSKGQSRQHTHHIKYVTENVKSAGLLPRVIHSYDAYVARQLVIRARTLGITVIPNHDSFMFDAQYETTIDMIVEEIFIEILQSNYLGYTLEELNTSGKSLALKDRDSNYITDAGLKHKYGTLTVDDLRNSEPMDLEEI